MLSIIIPCYNVSNFIDEALSSLLRQPYTIGEDFEIICIDDCSTDETLSRLRLYENAGVQIISLEKNAGVSHARNVGIQHACGDFIWFFDADDMASSNSMEMIFRCIDQKNIDAIRFQAAYVEEKSGIENIFTINQTPTKNNLYCFVFNRSFLFEKNISFCETMTYSEDVAFICLCFINEMRIKDISAVLYYYRQRSSSLMHKKNETIYFKSICYLPYYYNEYKTNNWLSLSASQQHKLQELIYDATQACLMHVVKRTSAELQRIVKDLSRDGLYPYPIRWNLLTTKHGVLASISKSRYLFAPVYGYLLGLNILMGKSYKAL